jgi:serine/threonine-protein kinase
MGLQTLTFKSIHQELSFLRAHARVTRLVDMILEDCLARGLGLEVALDVFLSQCARLLGASSGFVQLRGTQGPVLTRRFGPAALRKQQLSAAEGVHPFERGQLLVKNLAFGPAQFGAFGLVVEDLPAKEIPLARALVDAMGEQLDNTVLTFIALSDGASPAQRLDELAVAESFRPKARFGRYELLSPLGTGGMAQVFVARQKGPEGVGRLVALKRILPYLLDEPEIVEQFLDEARVSLQLAHANLAVVYDFGRTPGGYYLAMELVKGPSLAAVLARMQALEPRIAGAILVQTLHGLHAAHELCGDDGRPLDLVHRDLSPQNVMIGFDGTVKVLDFGIALTRDKRSQTELGIIKGKPLYMSPEQAMGEPIDRRSDLFAAGLILYEALTGERPFKRETADTTLDAIIEEPVHRHPRVPRKVWKVLSRALEKDRRQRHSNALELARDIEAAMEPVAPDELGKAVREQFADAYRAVQAWTMATAPQGTSAETKQGTGTDGR